ncbi:GIY-YIG nuclease family protein [Adlercreutzia equolifaciens]|nr:GIY-YIG nuclease family protein [Adlercreutzia equolifaciens]MDE8701666.1 GIY-YIG nuclease family protein [Adlercreutzia equolifaciens]
MYVLECVDGSLYTGYAVDVHARLAVHNAGKGAKYTRARLPVSLLAYASFETKHDAMHAEYAFKQLTRDEKDGLLSVAARSSFEEALRPLLEESD